MEDRSTIQIGSVLRDAGKNLLGALHSGQHMLEEHLECLKGHHGKANCHINRIHCTYCNLNQSVIRTSKVRHDLPESRLLQDMHACKPPHSVNEVSITLSNFTQKFPNTSIILPRTLNELHSRQNKRQKTSEYPSDKRLDTGAIKGIKKVDSLVDKPRIFELDDASLCYTPAKTSPLKLPFEKIVHSEHVETLVKEVHHAPKDSSDKNLIRSENVYVDEVCILPHPHEPVTKILRSSMTEENYVTVDSVGSPSSFSSLSDIMSSSNSVDIIQYRQSHLPVPHSILSPSKASKLNPKFKCKKCNKFKMKEQKLGSTQKRVTYKERHKKRYHHCDRQPDITYQSAVNAADGLQEELHPSLNVLDTRKGPVLGYDWVAGMIDSADHTILGRTSDFFDELKQFRESNKHECLSLKTLRGLQETVDENTDDCNHRKPCVHVYRINNRLFPEPCRTNEAGKSICSICKLTKEEASWRQKCTLKIHVPQQKLRDASELCAQRRIAGLDPESLALSRNCQPDEKKAPCVLLH